MIICLIEFGVLEFTALMPDGSQVKINVKDMAASLVAYAYQYKCQSIKLVGNQDYVKHFVKNIYEEEIKQYNNQTLNIEVYGRKEV